MLATTWMKGECARAAHHPLAEMLLWRRHRDAERESVRPLFDTMRLGGHPSAPLDWIAAAWCRS
jgi:hypothetical protein